MRERKGVRCLSRSNLACILLVPVDSLVLDLLVVAGLAALRGGREGGTEMATWANRNEGKRERECEKRDPNGNVGKQERREKRTRV